MNCLNKEWLGLILIVVWIRTKNISHFQQIIDIVPIHDIILRTEYFFFQRPTLHWSIFLFCFISFRQGFLTGINLFNLKRRIYPHTLNLLLAWKTVAIHIQNNYFWKHIGLLDQCFQSTVTGLVTCLTVDLFHHF